MFDTILLAVDGSKQTDYVVELACTLAANSAAIVYVTCCVDEAYSIDNQSNLNDQADDYLPAQHETNSAQALVNRCVKTLCTRSINARSHIIVGNPETALVDEACNLNASVIVIGHRHLSAFGRLLSGSVSAEVIAHSPCPVMVEVRGNQA